MLKRLALKELRETAGIALLAVIVYAGMVMHQAGVTVLPWMYSFSEVIPFVYEGFFLNFAVISACLAIALGLRQSTWESVGDTYQFLLHRPLGRGRIVGTKLLIGAGLCLLCTALPILAYAWWAAAPGKHASPFYWSMTVPAWKVWISMTGVYLGAFLSGIRPARWTSTRLVPLASAGILVFLMQFVPSWWILGLACVVLLDAVLVANVVFVIRTRDY